MAEKPSFRSHSSSSTGSMYWTTVSAATETQWTLQLSKYVSWGPDMERSARRTFLFYKHMFRTKLTFSNTAILSWVTVHTLINSYVSMCMVQIKMLSTNRVVDLNCQERCLNLIPLFLIAKILPLYLYFFKFAGLAPRD